ncbi:hypothetical protein S40293_02399 [Stachybotrys chartarum IBT 40293]|nr:hypothetical protein S40293_02399 [Stachybotrys chartarum IBT 40293]
MFTKISAAAAAVLAASTLVSAQTFTDCNPLERDCPSDPAFGSERVSCNLLEGACDAFHELEGTTVDYTEQGAIFAIERESNAPTIATDKYIFFGRVDVEIQAAPGQGIVTSAVLQSDCLDEIDWEWVGGDDLQVQTNYFSKGDTSTYDRGAYHPVDHPLTSFHTYTIDWTPEAVNWIIDGNVIRTLTYADAKGGSAFPQTPMQIKLGTWVAGRQDAPEGTVEWAGGYTNFDEAPFLAIYKSISIVDYAGGSGPASGAVREYIYGDRTGEWESIDIVGGSGRPSNGNNQETETTTSAEVESETSTSRARPTSTRTSSAASSTEEASSEPATTTTEASSTEAPTTLSTTASRATPAAESQAGTPVGADGAEETGGSAPPSAAPREAVTYGSLLLAGAAILAVQLL